MFIIFNVNGRDEIFTAFYSHDIYKLHTLQGGWKLYCTYQLLEPLSYR